MRTQSTGSSAHPVTEESGPPTFGSLGVSRDLHEREAAEQRDG
jgi:hypothetical protein